MSIQTLDFAEPFFTVRLLEGEAAYAITGRTILLNLAEAPVLVQDQGLGQFQSAVLHKTTIQHIDKAVLVERFDDYPDQEALFEQVRATWPTACDVRGEERLRGVQHYMSPKLWIGQLGLTMYHCASVPLKVGLHKNHDFCPVPGFREVHTQIAGFGKMQQCSEKDLETLYLEEPMAPGSTHRPMYDDEGNYPWHQFETITPSIMMAVEMLPDGATPPQL